MWSVFIPTPNLILKTLSSLGVKVDKIFVVASLKLDLIACSKGANAFVSSIKSPKLLSSSSPTGFSSDTGSFEILSTFLTFSKGILNFLAKKLRMPLEKVRKVLKISKEPVSLEKPVGDEEDSSLGDFIEDTKAFVSSIKSPKLLSSSSPTGFSSDTGSFEILSTFLTFSKGILNFLAKKLRMPLEKVRKVLKISKEPVSLEKPVGDEEDSSLGDFIEDTKALAPLEQAIKSNLSEATTKILSTLTPREERVLRMRFGVGMNTDHTLEEVGLQFSVTRERIRQIEAKALRKLKHPSRSKQLKSFLES